MLAAFIYICFIWIKTITPLTKDPNKLKKFDQFISKMLAAFICGAAKLHSKAVHFKFSKVFVCSGRV